VTLSDVIFCWTSCWVVPQSKQQIWRRRKKILLYANKMHGTLSMVDIAMDRLCVAKTEQLLTGKGRRNQLLVGKNSNVEFDGTEP